MAINAVNKFYRTSEPSMNHGTARYRAEITSTTATGTTDITAAGDYTVNFNTVFKAAPKVLSGVLQTATSGAAGTFPVIWVKSVSTTAMVVSIGGTVGTLSNARIVVDLECEQAS